MQYISTRNTEKVCSFKDVFLNGLAPDGGLYVPKQMPSYSSQGLEKLKNLSYRELAVKIILDFCADEFSESEIQDLIKKSYKDFRVKEVVSINKIGKLNLLELFHGPTLAFKDIAMQVIGNMYENLLKKINKKINIIVATSGDTGAAAIDAIKGRKNINIFVLHPKDKVSEIQRKLMTTVKENNVFNIAVEGNFDDCQNLVKSMFIDNEFKNKINMSGVNSINWARIISQIVYYFYAYFKIKEKDKKINFSVPTGNFGDVYAGYVSKKMGLPINRLIVATNQNDILKKAINTGDYKIEKVVQTISPSMDIQVASNFERLIFDTNSNNDLDIKEKMKNLKEKNVFKIDKNQLENIKNDFVSESLNENETYNSIKNFYSKYNIILDPHTAVGYGVLEKISCEGINVILGTAHPCKFPEAVYKAINLKPELPKEFSHILSEKEKYDVIENNIEKIKKAILTKI